MDGIEEPRVSGKSRIETPRVDRRMPPRGGKGWLPLLIRMAVILIFLGVIGVLGYLGHNFIRGKLHPRSQVGCIDRQKIFDLPEFQAANKELDKKSMELQKKFAGDQKKNLSPEELEKRFGNYQMELNRLRAKLMNPLLSKAEAAVAVIARGKKMNVVLDKRVIVYGVPDISDAVVEKMKKEKEIPFPKETPSESSQIGYFDQEVIRALKMFREADMKLFDISEKMRGKFKEELQNASSTEKEYLVMKYSAEFDQLKQEILSPLYKKVTKVVEEVAKEQKLSLVMDKQAVMYGGRNLTDLVIEKIRKSE